MQIFVHFLIVSSVLGFNKDFHKFILGGVVLMDYVSCLQHLAVDYEFGCGAFLFGRLKSVYRFLGLFLLFGFCFKFLYSNSIRIDLFRFFCELRAKSMNLSCSENVVRGKLFALLKFSNAAPSVPNIDKIEMKKTDVLNFRTDSDGEIDSDSDSGSDSDTEFVDKNNEYADDVDEFDITKLKELLKTERRRVHTIRAELAKERAAAATAAEEAMSMILRLQNEKSLLEMESSQYRRLTEEKQIHDQEVIRSLQWLVWQHEFEKSLPKDDQNPRKKFKEDEHEEDETSFNGNILNALENVLYSSRDSTAFSPY